MSLYKEKYRVESSRLRNWDYTSDGYYFITICTINRMHYFGDIINDKMILSKIGEIAYQYWQEIPNHFPFVQLDQFVIMPNHVHGIIIINNHHTKMHGFIEMYNPVETQDLASLPTKLTETKSKFGPQSRNIGSIIRGFKIGVTKESNKDKIPFGWQPRFYDHIIRSNQDLRRIRKYIQNNPCVWKDDDFYAKKMN